MSGAHRRPGEAGASGYARLLAWVIGSLAAVAGLIWLFATATALKLLAAALILGAAGLVKGLVQGKLDMIWLSVGTVVGFGWEVIRDVTHQPGGSLVGYLVRAVVLACATIGLIKAGGLGWVGRVIRDR